MQVILMTAATGLALLGGAFCLVFARLITWHRIISAPDNPHSAFSAARYREIQRLLNESDEKVISKQPGWNWLAQFKFRDGRVRIFHDYMRELFDDFNRICRAIRWLMSNSEAERSDLAGLIMKQHFVFALRLMATEVRLILYGLGWGSVELRVLIRSVDTMRSQLQEFAAIAQPAGSGLPAPDMSAPLPG
jgi:hypothetical protein